MAMDLVPPQDTFLGLLEIDEVYVDYEGPRFFCAVSRSGRRYLALHIDESETSDIYLYLPISDDRFKIVRSGGLSVRTAFVEPEDGRLYTVTADYSSGLNMIDAVSVNELTSDQLPAADVSLSISTATRPTFKSDQLAVKSGRERRTFLAFEIEPATMLRTELPLRSLSRIAGTLQDTIDALAQEVAGRPTPRGMIPQDILRDSELVFRESQAASFVLVAASASQAGHEDRLMESQLLEHSCERLVGLLNESESPDRLRDLVGSYGVRVRAKYRALLEALLDEGTGVSAFVATEFGHGFSGSLKPAEVKANLGLLREIGTEVVSNHLERVNIVGVNLRTGSFELYDSREDKKYSGRMELDARDQIAGLPTGFEHFYSADLLAQEQYSNFSDEVRWTYRLVSIGEPYGLSAADVPVVLRAEDEAG